MTVKEGRRNKHNLRSKLDDCYSPQIPCWEMSFDYNYKTKKHKIINWFVFSTCHLYFKLYTSLNTRLQSCAPAVTSVSNKKPMSGFLNDIRLCKFPTWRPAGCRRGRSGRSRSALRPQTPTSAPINSPCSSSQDGALPSHRRRPSTGRSNEVR